MRTRPALLILCVLAVANAAYAQTSDPLVQHQGLLRQRDGSLFDGAVDLTFEIYAAPTGGEAVWSELHEDVPVSRGVFRVLLGSVNPIRSDDFGLVARWLRTAVAGQPSGPRQRIVLPADLVALDRRLAALERRPAPPRGAAGSDPIDVPGELRAEVRRVEAERQRRRLATRRALLLPRGELELEPFLTHGFSSSDALAIEGFALLPVLVVGEIQSEQVRRDVVSAGLVASFGLTDDLEVDIAVPFRYRSDEFVSVDNERRDGQAFGLGDVRFGLSGRMPTPSSGIAPDLIWRIQGSAPTGRDPFDFDPRVAKDVPLGTGHWAMGGGVSGVLPVDPALLFGSVDVLYSLPRHARGDVIDGRVKPGIVGSYSLGASLALSYELTANLRFQHTLGASSEIEGVRLHGSGVRDARLFLGGAWAYAPDRILSFSVGVGLTEDAPDLSVSFSMPIRLRPLGE